MFITSKVSKDSWVAGGRYTIEAMNKGVIKVEDHEEIVADSSMWRERRPVDISSMMDDGGVVRIRMWCAMMTIFIWKEDVEVYMPKISGRRM
jgi:hypothetical protein